MLRMNACVVVPSASQQYCSPERMQISSRPSVLSPPSTGVSPRSASIFRLPKKALPLSATSLKLCSQTRLKCCLLDVCKRYLWFSSSSPWRQLAIRHTNHIQFSQTPPEEGPRLCVAASTAELSSPWQHITHCDPRCGSLPFSFHSKAYPTAQQHYTRVPHCTLCQQSPVGMQCKTLLHSQSQLHLFHILKT